MLDTYISLFNVKAPVKTKIGTSGHDSASLVRVYTHFANPIQSSKYLDIQLVGFIERVACWKRTEAIANMIQESPSNSS